MSDSDVFREVDEDYRREQTIAFWRRHGALVLALLIAVMIVAAGANYWRQRVLADHSAETAELERVLSSVTTGNETPAADNLAAFAAKASPKPATLALFAEAGLRQRTGALDAAARIYHQIADNTSVDADFRDLALIRLGYIATDEAKPEPLIPRLQALVDKNSPWRYSAREVIALLTVRAGQRDAAAALFSNLASDPGAPPDLAERAHALADLYRGK
jgi:hypothetical protein